MVRITPPTGHEKISPTMFHSYAKQFYQCKKGFEVLEAFSPVPYFLLCRAIELELKARHLETRSRDAVKKDYGHNIKKAYDELDASKRVLDKDEYSVLEKASTIYDRPKGFEYCSVRDAGTGGRDFPDIDVLDRIAHKLIGNPV